MRVSVLLLLVACAQPTSPLFAPPPKGDPVVALQKSESDWKSSLTAEQFRVLREKGTERPFTGRFNDHHATGTYVCAACGHPLFASSAKFDSGTGWPSFFTPVDTSAVTFHSDGSVLMQRTEVVCQKCGSHLGHVFHDGPAPTGLRYCINSVALDFRAP